MNKQMNKHTYEQKNENYIPLGIPEIEVMSWNVVLMLSNQTMPLFESAKEPSLIFHNSTNKIYNLHILDVFTVEMVSFYFTSKYVS